MRKLLALSLLTLTLVGGWLTRKHSSLDGPVPPPQCAPDTCPPR